MRSTAVQWSSRPRPERAPLTGRYCRLEPLDPARHGDQLFAASMAPVYQAASQELEELLAEAGINWISQARMLEEWPEINEPLRGSLDTEAQSSTWQSLAREQGTVETEFLNGEVLRLAERLGRPAPVNEMLLKIILEMADNREHPGKYTAAQLGSILGLTP